MYFLFIFKTIAFFSNYSLFSRGPQFRNNGPQLVHMKGNDVDEVFEDCNSFPLDPPSPIKEVAGFIFGGGADGGTGTGGGMSAGGADLVADVGISETIAGGAEICVGGAEGVIDDMSAGEVDAEDGCIVECSAGPCEGIIFDDSEATPKRVVKKSVKRKLLDDEKEKKMLRDAQKKVDEVGSDSEEDDDTEDKVSLIISILLFQVILI